MGGALEKAMENQVFVGIDVSKASLDMALRPGAESCSDSAALCAREKNKAESRWSLSIVARSG
jgi:hypothetical protein